MTETQPLRPERPSVELHKALQARMFFVASNLTATNIEVLNPKNKNIAPISREQIKSLDERDFSLFDAASNGERPEVEVNKLEAEFNKTINKNTAVIVKFAKNHNLSRLLGDPKKLNFKNVRSILVGFFEGDTKSADTKSFAQWVIKQYTEGEKIITEALNTDLESIQWLARIFGEQSAQVVIQNIDAEVKLRTDPQYIENANNARNDVTEGPEAELLQFLYDSRSNLEMPEEPTDHPQKPLEPDPDQPQIPEGELHLKQIFDMVKGPVNKNQPYYIDNPNATIDMPEEKLKELEVVEPFFILGRPNAERQVPVSPNRKIVPFQFELGAVDEQDKPIPTADKRYLNAEKFTDEDAGSLALAAASASNSENQALLYGAYTDAVIRIHSNSLTDTTQPALIRRWLEAQGKDPEQLNSLKLFFDFDHKDNNPDAQLRDPDERLLLYNEDGSINYGQFEEYWRQRLKKLQEIHAAGKLNRNHIRWIEFLSHSVNTPELWKLIREQQTQPVKNNGETGEFKENRLYEEYIKALTSHEKINIQLNELKAKYEKDPLKIVEDPAHETLISAESAARAILDEKKTDVSLLEDKLIPQALGTTFEDINNKATPENQEPHQRYNALKKAVIEFQTANLRRNGDMQGPADKLDKALSSFNNEMKKVDPTFKTLTLEEFLLNHTNLLNPPQPTKDN